ncbi:MAG TPA: S9 family peptidase [Acidobacteriaceae bacterium]|jgi:oligopeptidase B
MRNLLVLVLCSLPIGVLAQSLPSPDAPVAKKIHTEHPINGAVLVDDYAWLRERQNPEVKALLEQENAYADKVLTPLKPVQDTLYKEMLSHIQQTDDSVPYPMRGYLYYNRTMEGKQYPVLCRKKASLAAPEEVLLDMNAMAVGEKFMSVAAFQISPDNNLLAYTTDTVGFRQYKLHVKDLRTGKILPDTAERVTSVEWAADNHTLLYVTEDATTKRSDLMFRHELGQTSADPVVFNEKDERFDLGVGKTRDGKYLLLQDGSHITSEVQFLPADKPMGAWTILEPRKENVQYSADEGNGLWYIRINDTGKNYRLVTVPTATPERAHWKEVLAVRKDVPLEDVDVFQSFYVLTERVKGLPVLRIIRPGAATKTIDFPEPAYVVSGAANAEFTTSRFRYAYQSPVTPNSTFDYDVTVARSMLLKQQTVPGGFDKTKYAVERLWAPAKDGTQVPVTVVYRKDKFHKGENPLYQYGYGSYGITMPDTFSSTRLVLLDRGVVYALAHIRGGGELGDEWHDSGKMMTKRNTFTDFIDVTEFLVKSGYGKSGHVGMEGGSAGGLLMGAVTNMRPDLYKAVLCEVPFVDVMNTMLDASLPLTVGEYEEWGNPNEKAAFDYMRTYSPYDNVEAKNYPNIMVRTSFDDSQVMYWEPAKYVSKLRAMKTDKNTLVFLVNMHGGHGGSSGRYDSLKDTAMNYAFLLHELDASQSGAGGSGR